ncbi:MAG: dihydroorotase [Christensenellaceae bacterium]|jgi:dihydroorotase|nr:dihydroorotase [Christensenellaceae bacterium]
MSRLKIQNARLIDARGERFGELYASQGKISLQPVPFDLEIDAQGLVLMPALIDLHCHLRDPGLTYKEDIESGMRAALKGGYGTLCAMANTKPVLSTPEMVEKNLEKAKNLRLCGLIQAAAAGLELKDETPTDWAALSKATKLLSNDGQTIFSDEFMRELLLASAKYGFLLSTHCQPERKTIARDLALLKETRGNLHIGHISHRESLAQIRAAKREGLRFSCEVTPHHLFGWGSDYRVNPPLREKADVDALIQGIKDGVIDCLSTDHAPHSPEDKQKGLAGISNIEHALPIFLEVFGQNGIPLTALSEMASRRPAELLGLRKGLLQEGYDADLTLIDPDSPGVIRANDMISRSHNTPFDGKAIRGKVLYTIVEGEIRYDARN